MVDAIRREGGDWAGVARGRWQRASLAMLVLITLAAACAEAAQKRPEAQPPEDVLASRGGGGTAQEYGAVLRSLRSKCKESAESLADLASVTRQRIVNAGREVSSLEILRRVDSALTPGATGVTCWDIFLRLPVAPA